MSEDDLNRLFRLLLEQLPLGVIITDKQGEMLFVNQAACEIRHVDGEKLIGRNILQCHANRSQETVRRAVEYMKSNPKTNYRRMVEDRVNGRYYQNSYNSISDGDGVMKGMAVITTDVTESRKFDLERARQTKIQDETIRSVQLQYHNLLNAALESFCNILDAKDAYTQNHSKRVSNIATRLYERKYGLNGEYLDIRTAANLHDIGKICIPDAIMNKPGKLEPEEYNVIKRHPILAAEILRPVDMGRKISTIVRHHHERYDGSGYPDGLSGDAIPIGARIIAIADTFDAMSSDRPYRNAYPYSYCIEEIRRQAGKQFDPEWVDVFCEYAETGSLE